MTTKHIFLASTFLFAAVVCASAQQTAPSPAPSVFLPELHKLTELEHQFAYAEFDKLGDHINLAHDFKNLAHDFKPFNVEVDKLFSLQQTPFQIGKGSAEGAYSQARGFIDRDQYDRALDPLDRVITAKGDRADAAMYWKAYSLWKLARRDEALSTLAQMQKQYPDSRWLRDARALEVEVKQASGQSVATDALNDELKLLALQGIMRTDAEAALPAVEKMLAGGGSVRIKERALFVLSQSRSDRARDIIGNVARGNANPDLQQRAIRYLGVSNSPEAVNTLVAVYKADSSTDTRRAVISALASSQSRSAGAVSALVTLARGERDPELKTAIVRHLANSNSPEAKQYMLELLK